MEGRSKSRFLEKCKNEFRGRFLGRFRTLFGTTFGSQSYFLSKKEAPKNGSKKGTPQMRNECGETLLPSRMAPGKAPPRVKELLSNQTRNNCLSNCCSIVVDLLQKKVSRCKKSEMVAGNSESVAKKVNRLLKVVLNP